MYNRYSLHRTRCSRTFREWEKTLRSQIIAGLVALASISSILFAGPNLASATEPRPTCNAGGQPVFNDPFGTKQEKFEVLDFIMDCIYASKAGSDIYVTSPHWEIVRLSRALIWADEHDRNVRVIVPMNLWHEEAVELLREHLGTDVSKRSYIKFCKNACLAVSKDGHTHGKTYLFSDSGGNQNITTTTSMNPTPRQSQIRYNDLVAITNPVIYDKTREYFRLMKFDKPADFPAVVSTDDYEMWYMPTTDPDRPDFYSGLLNGTRCETSQAAGRNGRTVVNWAAPQLLNSVHLAERAVQMHERGCKLRVLLTLDNSGRKMLWKLRRGGVNVRYLWSQEHPVLNHQKNLIISGTHRGEVVNTVYTGTRNAVDSQSTTDNTMLRIKNDESFTDTYRQRFRQMWSTATELTGDAIQAYVASQQV
jgi:hypothetical protein